MKYNVRQMEITDIEQVCEMEDMIFGETLGYDMFYTELTLNPYAYYFVLDIDDEIGGYIGTWIEGDRGEVINFCIDKEYQGMGFGKMLLSFYLELAKMSEVKTVSLEVRKSNEKAIKLYESFGFKKSHVRENYYKDLEDALVLVKNME